MVLVLPVVALCALSAFSGASAASLCEYPASALTCRLRCGGGSDFTPGCYRRRPRLT